MSNAFCIILMHIKNATDNLVTNWILPMRIKLQFKPEKYPIDENTIIPKTTHQ